MRCPLVSIVINFHNEIENVDMAPLALTKQNYQNFEVIFVDDGSTENTLNLILKKYQSKLPKIKLLCNAFPVGLRKARNQGVRVARGEIIITLDLHTTFDESFIKRIVSAFATHNDVAAVGALILPYGDRWFHYGFGTLNRVILSFRRLFRNYHFVFGTAAAYRADVLDKIGYLSEGEIVEDVDASWKIRKEGYTILTLEDNIVLHKGPQSFKKFLKTFIRDGIRLALLLRKYKRKIIYPQSFLRISVVPLLILFLLFFPFYTVSIICGIALFLLLLGYVVSKQLKNAFSFLIISIIYMIIISLSTNLGFLLSIMGKVDAIKKHGLEW